MRQAAAIALLCAGCLVWSTEIDSQLGKINKGMAETVYENGCAPKSPAASILLDTAKHHARKLGRPKFAAPVNTVNPDAGDAKTTKDLCRRSEEDDKRRAGWVWKLIAGATGTTVAGGGIWMMLRRMLSGGGASKMLKTLVDAGECIKAKLPKAQRGIVGDAIREAARPHGTSGQIADTFEKRIKNGGQT